MSFSQGDVVWLRIDKLEGGLGREHPAVVVSNNAFNDTHDWGYVVRGSHTIPAVVLPEENIVRRSAENGLSQDTIFSSILFSANWTRMTTTGGKVPPSDIRGILARVAAILTT